MIFDKDYLKSIYDIEAVKRKFELAGFEISQDDLCKIIGVDFSYYVSGLGGGFIDKFLNILVSQRNKDIDLLEVINEQSS